MQCVRLFQFVFYFTFLGGLLTVSQSQASSKVHKPRLKIAVIDTGIDFEHEYLTPFIRIPSKEDGVDQNGHGTHIAGIIVKNLKGKMQDLPIEIIPIKYYSSHFSNSKLTFSFANALKRALELDVNIINISVGGPKPMGEELKLLKEAQSRNILIIAAAGNKQIGQKNFSFYPAAYNLPHILSIVGTNQAGAVLTTSNVNGGKVNLYYPGENIRSTLPGDKFGELTGSSQAAAIATAEIASVWLQKGREFVWKTFLKSTDDQNSVESHQASL